MQTALSGLNLFKYREIHRPIKGARGGYFECHPNTFNHHLYRGQLLLYTCMSLHWAVLGCFGLFLGYFGLFLAILSCVELREVLLSCAGMPDVHHYCNTY